VDEETTNKVVETIKEKKHLAKGIKQYLEMTSVKGSCENNTSI